MTTTITTDLPLLEWRKMGIEEKLPIVAKLAREGMSASQIAKHFSDISRNSIIGFCHRNDIKLLGKQGWGRVNESRVSDLKKSAQKGRPPKPAARPPRIERPAEPMPDGVPFIETTAETCKWPLWETLPLRASSAPCCGRPTAEGKPYCDYHTGLARGRGTESERTAHKELARHAA